MKVAKPRAKRNYYLSLTVFLLALGLVPASLFSNRASAETEQTTVFSNEIAHLDDQLINPLAPVEETPTAETVEEVSEPQTADEPTEEPEAAEPVETPATVETYVAETITYTVAEPVIYEEPVTYEEPAVEVYQAPAYDQITIAGNTIPIFYSDNTLIDAGNQVGLYGSHFLYGHNTGNVFGGLQYLGNGAQFTVTLNGATKTYQVVGRDLQAKSHFEGETVLETKTAGMTIRTKMKVMKAITAYGAYDGNYYDYILMTCAGTSYGNGDASHRLVLFANEV